MPKAIFFLWIIIIFGSFLVADSRYECLKNFQFFQAKEEAAALRLSLSTAPNSGLPVSGLLLPLSPKLSLSSHFLIADDSDDLGVQSQLLAQYRSGSEEQWLWSLGSFNRKFTNSNIRAVLVALSRFQQYGATEYSITFLHLVSDRSINALHLGTRRAVGSLFSVSLAVTAWQENFLHFQPNLSLELNL